MFEQINAALVTFEATFEQYILKYSKNSFAILKLNVSWNELYKYYFQHVHLDIFFLN